MVIFHCYVSLPEGIKQDNPRTRMPPPPPPPSPSPGPPSAPLPPSSPPPGPPSAPFPSGPAIESSRERGPKQRVNTPPAPRPPQLNGNPSLRIREKTSEDLILKALETVAQLKDSTRSSLEQRLVGGNVGSLASARLVGLEAELLQRAEEVRGRDDVMSWKLVFPYLNYTCTFCCKHDIETHWSFRLWQL